MKEQIRKEQDQLIPLLWVRRSIGFFGILLPPVLVLGTYLFSTCPPLLDAVSDYYHSVMRDVFVGVICSIALFLFTYRGYDKSDTRVSNLASIFALGIVFFPTDYTTDTTCIYVSKFQAKELHNICAIGFFLAISYFSLVLFPKTGESKDGKSIQPTKQKEKRNVVFITCGIIMLACIALIGLDEFVLERKITKALNLPFTIMFICEWIALWAFGTSWIVKGELILQDKKQQNKKPKPENN